MTRTINPAGVLDRLWHLRRTGLQSPALPDVMALLRVFYASLVRSPFPGAMEVRNMDVNRQEFPKVLS